MVHLRNNKKCNSEQNRAENVSSSMIGSEQKEDKADCGAPKFGD